MRQVATEFTTNFLKKGKKCSNVKLCVDWFTKYWCVSLAMHNWNFRTLNIAVDYSQGQLRENFLIKFLPSGLMKIQIYQNCHVNMTSSISNGPMTLLIE